MSAVKKIFFLLSLVILAVIAGSFVFIADPPVSEPAYADGSDNVAGHAWSANVGWLSFNCVNHENRCDGDANVSCVVNQDCVDAGAGTACLAACTESDYGVNIDESTGEFSGHAWSEHVGWISFDRAETGAPPAQPYKTGSTYIAHYNSGSDEITGWAKVLSLGESGWLKLRRFSSDGGPDYGLALNESGEFTGWAWNGNDDGSGIGWVSFNCSDSGAGGCTASDYKVYRDTPPQAQNLSMNYPRVTKEASYCLDPAQAPTHYDIGQVILRWEFTDTEDGTTQTAFELEIDNNPGFGSPVIDTGQRTAAGQQYFIGADAACDTLVTGSCDTLLAANTTYYWHVNVWDGGGNQSGWVSGPSFTTEPHNYPTISSMAASPSQPQALEDTYFSQTTEAYGGTSIAGWSWTFTNAQPTASSTPNPGPVQFQSADDQTATLTVTDTSALSCTRTLDLTSGISLPIWQEIKPE